MHRFSGFRSREDCRLRFGTAVIGALAAICGIVAAPVSAQSINIDFGTAAGVPSSDYGAAAGQPGVWNGLTGEYVLHPLVGLDGTPINATMEFSSVIADTVWSDDPATLDDDERLLDDYLQIGGDIIGAILFSGLDNGPYELVAYLWDQTPALIGTHIWVCPPFRPGSSSIGVFSSEPWVGTFDEGVTHGVLSTEVTDGTLCLAPVVPGGLYGGGDGSINGMQLTLVPEPATLMLAGAGGLVLMARRLGQSPRPLRGIARSVLTQRGQRRPARQRQVAHHLQRRCRVVR